MAYDAENFAVTILPLAPTLPRVVELRDFIANMPPRLWSYLNPYTDYNIEEPQPVHDCKTACCFLGWAQALFQLKTECNVAIGNHLELTEEQREELFFGSGFGSSKPQAVAVLDHLLATGKVDWSVAT